MSGTERTGAQQQPPTTQGDNQYYPQPVAQLHQGHEGLQTPTPQGGGPGTHPQALPLLVVAAEAAAATEAAAQGTPQGTAPMRAHRPYSLMAEQYGGAYEAGTSMQVAPAPKRQRMTTSPAMAGPAETQVQQQSKYHGVTWYKASRRWQARLCTGRKQYHLGYFKTEEEAARAYDRAVMQYEGPTNAQLNFPESAAAEALAAGLVAAGGAAAVGAGGTAAAAAGEAASRHSTGYYSDSGSQGTHTPSAATSQQRNPRSQRPGSSRRISGGRYSGGELAGRASGGQGGQQQQQRRRPAGSGGLLGGVQVQGVSPVDRAGLMAAAGADAVPGVLFPDTGTFMPSGPNGRLEVYEFEWDGAALRLKTVLSGQVGPAAAAQGAQGEGSGAAAAAAAAAAAQGAAAAAGGGVPAAHAQSANAAAHEGEAGAGSAAGDAAAQQPTAQEAAAQAAAAAAAAAAAPGAPGDVQQ